MVSIVWFRAISVFTILSMSEISTYLKLFECIHASIHWTYDVCCCCCCCYTFRTISRCFYLVRVTSKITKMKNQKQQQHFGAIIMKMVNTVNYCEIHSTTGIIYKAHISTLIHAVFTMNPVFSVFSRFFSCSVVGQVMSACACIYVL